MSKEENKPNINKIGKKKEEEVILVKGNSSKWYEQAIFIINPKNSNDLPVDFVKEAELIISQYLSNKGVKAYENNSNWQRNNMAVLPKKNSNNKTAITKKTAIRNSSSNSFAISKELDVLINSIMLICCIILAGIVLNLMI